MRKNFGLILALCIFFLFFHTSYGKERVKDLQNQVIETYKQIIDKEKQIEQLNLEINKSKQEQEILKKKIKNKENILKSIIFLFKDNKNKTDFAKFLNSLGSRRSSIVTKNLVTKSIYEITKKDLNIFLDSLSIYKTNEETVLNKKKSLAIQKKKLEKFKRKLDKEISRKNAKEEPSLKKKFEQAQLILKNTVKDFDDLIKATTIKKKSKLKKKLPNIVKLPVIGEIISNFGQSKNYLTKNGILFQPKKGSYITSPISGRVKWAETLKGHGNVLIIDNALGYHSILTGVEKIITEVGSEVVAGEPIAKNDSANEEPQKVYFELRYKGKIIDPKRRVEIL